MTDLSYFTREHHNHEGAGWCCPHCLESDCNEFDGSYDTAKAVRCNNFGEMFAIMLETDIMQSSGFIDEDDLWFLEDDEETAR